jgi:hypothetical protein
MEEFLEAVFSVRSSLRLLFLSIAANFFENAILKMVQSHIEVRNMINASQFGFRARHSTTQQCMRLTEHMTLNFNNNISTAPVLLDIGKAFHTIWHPVLLYELRKLKFSTNLIKLISFFVSERKFAVSVQGEMSKPREIQARVRQDSVLSPILYSN